MLEYFESINMKGKKILAQQHHKFTEICVTGWMKTGLVHMEIITWDPGNITFTTI